MAIAFAISRCVVKWCAGALIRFFGSPANSNGDRGLSPPMGGRVMITDILRPDADLGGSVVRVGGRSHILGAAGAATCVVVSKEG